jgi:hypothetical protein
MELPPVSNSNLWGWVACPRNWMKISMLVTSVLVLMLLAKGDASQGQPNTSAPERIELTESDLFSAQAWNSRDISILGFHLSQTWSEAVAQAAKRNLRLMESGIPGRESACIGRGWCMVCENPRLCDGLALDFEGDRRISAMSITKIGDEAEMEAQENAIQRRLKGKTYDLFEHYAKDLRLRLLGPEDMEQSDPTTRIYTVKYRRPGIVFLIMPCPAGPVESACSSLRVEFRIPD